eukprot:s5703_g2.t1
MFFLRFPSARFQAYPVGFGAQAGRSLKSNLCISTAFHRGDLLKGRARQTPESWAPAARLRQPNAPCQQILLRRSKRKQKDGVPTCRPSRSLVFWGAHQPGSWDSPQFQVVQRDSDFHQPGLHALFAARSTSTWQIWVVQSTSTKRRFTVSSRTELADFVRFFPILPALQSCSMAQDELTKYFERVQAVVDYLKQYDKDNSGTLSSAEVQAAIRGTVRWVSGSELSQEKLQASVAKMPSNSDPDASC